MVMSKVYLIGAGPGDEELLTLKGKRVLEKCTQFYMTDLLTIVY